jgi:hypothetical protein
VRLRRSGFACWQSLAKNPWFIGPVLAELVPPPQPQPASGRSPTGPFVFADPDYVRAILRAAGFVDIAVAAQEYAIEAPEKRSDR